jgi:hypothetical protein
VFLEIPAVVLGTEILNVEKRIWNRDVVCEVLRAGAELQVKLRKSPKRVRSCRNSWDFLTSGLQPCLLCDW